MARTRRSAEQRARDREEVERCLVRNVGVDACAEKLGLTPSQIASLVQEIRADWLEAANATPVEVRAGVLARLRQLELAAWSEWERSCSTRTRRKTARKTAGGKSAGATEAAELATEDRVGDPRFLAEIRANLAQQAALLIPKQQPGDPHSASLRHPSPLDASLIRARDRRDSEVLEQSGFLSAPLSENEYELIGSGDSAPTPRLVVVRSRAELQRFEQVCVTHGIPLAGESASAAKSPEDLSGRPAAKVRPSHET